jgi:protein involved in polysaccharide export with SLBB domain
MGTLRRAPGVVRRLAGLGVVLVGVALTLVACGPAISVPAFSPEELVRLQRQSDLDHRSYRVQAGDTLLIRYPFHQEMDQEAVVRPDGHITVPTFGAVRVGQLTPPAIEDELKQLTSTRLRNPEVVVNILRYGERPVYVGGEVGRPGALVYRQGLTALQAVLASGGFLPTARLDSVVIIRPETGGSGYMARKLDLERVVAAGDKEEIMLAPNDLVFVPRTRIAHANLWVRQHVTELFPFFRMQTMPYPGLQ